MSFRELVNEKRTESTGREDCRQCDGQPRIAEPRAVASGCYNQIYRTIRPLRTMRVASVATARGSAISTDLREELELAGKHLVE